MKRLLAAIWPFIPVLMFIASSAMAEISVPMTVLEKKLYEEAKKEGKLIYWESLSMKEASQFIKAFTERYPGIEVSYWEGQIAECDQKYFTERRAGRRPVDIMGVEDLPRYKKDSLLENLGDIIKDTNYPKEFCTKELDALAVEHSIKGAAYNTKLVAAKDVPRTWDDLLDPKWRGKISVETGLDVFNLLTKAWGENKTVAYLKRLREQDLIFVKGGTLQLTLLGAGEFPIAVEAGLHRTIDLQSKGLPVDWVPTNPAVDKLTPLTVLRDAPHPNAAKLYMRWLLSPEGKSLVEKIRRKGDPLPGSGSIQSKKLEQMGLKVSVVPVWDIDFKRLESVYQNAIGFSKDMKVIDKK